MSERRSFPIRLGGGTQGWECPRCRRLNPPTVILCTCAASRRHERGTDVRDPGRPRRRTG